MKYYGLLTHTIIFKLISGASMSLIFNDEELMWIWAFNEQLHLHDFQDAHWIKRAKNKWLDSSGRPDLEEVRDFAYTYQLRLGRNRVIYDHTDTFLRICNTHFHPPIEPFSFEEAGERWKNAVGEISTSGCNANLWSATSKMFWMYHPEHLPMFDRFSFRGMKNWILPRRGLKERNFIDEFGDFYSNAKHFMG